MRVPLLALGLIVVVGIASLCPGADAARRAPSAVKRSRTRQPEPVLRGRWRKRLCSRNTWTPVCQAPFLLPESCRADRVHVATDSRWHRGIPRPGAP